MLCKREKNVSKKVSKRTYQKERIEKKVSERKYRQGTFFSLLCLSMRRRRAGDASPAGQPM